ncbi:MAG: pantothenate kinase [Oscillatoriales cyanobacterium RM2_1_1]|nr:pantothenate kinase [Oscillatoriales cyanobacterium SM2_3_0]NJO44293.1 pantothenate kinase [Oscillatoriales cyanobacterium RM2_1_1]
MIGNSRLHWARFSGKDLSAIWHSDYLSQDDIQNLSAPLQMAPIILASVVAEQTQRWQYYPHLQIITLDQIPLKNLYPTLGIDRALAGLGAGAILGWPVLVIDAGTALTFTGFNGDRTLAGGAILPGLSLQFSSLHDNTGDLPAVTLPDQLPSRWALTTSAAIQSGILYTTLAGIGDFITVWLEQFPGSQIALTGGDAQALCRYLNSYSPHLLPQIQETPAALFWGMAEIVWNAESFRINFRNP